MKNLFNGNFEPLKKEIKKKDPTKMCDRWVCRDL